MWKYEEQQGDFPSLPGSGYIKTDALGEGFCECRGFKYRQMDVRRVRRGATAQPKRDAFGVGLHGTPRQSVSP